MSLDSDRPITELKQTQIYRGLSQVWGSSHACHDTSKRRLCEVRAQPRNLLVTLPERKRHGIENVDKQKKAQ